LRRLTARWTASEKPGFRPSALREAIEIIDLMAVRCGQKQLNMGHMAIDTTTLL
jgi:hypothetical protein